MHNKVDITLYSFRKLVPDRVTSREKRAINYHYQFSNNFLSFLKTNLSNKRKYNIYHND